MEREGRERETEKEREGGREREERRGEERSEEKREKGSTMCIMEGQLSMYCMDRAL